MVVLLTVNIEDVPFVPAQARAQSEDLGSGFYRVILRYGFMQDPDVPAALTGYDICGAKFKMMDTSFFLARQTLLPSSRSEENTSALQSLMRISSAVFFLKIKNKN